MPSSPPLPLNSDWTTPPRFRGSTRVNLRGWKNDDYPNAPATCQGFVNDTLREHLDVFCVCYLDDILIYSDNLADHRKQVRLILKKLSDAGLFVKPEKCEFETTKTTFLGFVISQKGISMDPEKVSAVRDWESPTCISDVQCFLGLANFYRRFIEGFSRICTPLYNLLKKEEGPEADGDKPVNPAQHQKNLRKAPFLWNSVCEKVFLELKTKFCTARSTLRAPHHTARSPL